MAEYIKRTDALKIIDEVHGARSAYHRVRNIPAADVAPVRHGRWKKWGGDDRHHCTVCECYADAERDGYGYITYEFLGDYCPNCGAKMDLEAPDA